MKRVLVTGAGGAATANFVKCLRMSGEPFHIVGVDWQPYHLEIADVDARYRVPLSTEDGYIDALGRVIERESVEMVHPQPDLEVFAISEARERVQARMCLPSKDVIRTCQDKAATAAVLRRAGVAVAEGFALAERALAEAFGALRSRHDRLWLRARRGAGGRASLPVTRLAEAEGWLTYWAGRGLVREEFMLSEALPGAEFAFQSLWRDGALVTSAARERMQYLFGYVAPSGQTSTPSVARTVHRDDVNDIAAAAVRAVAPGATGVFCVDLKENAAGIPCVTEINAGRFFTTSNFLAEAGANMPYHYVRMAYGEELPPLPPLNAVPAGWHWVRMMDMGHRLVKGDRWSSVEA